MHSQEFTAVIETNPKWKNSAFVRIPFDVNSVFGSGRPQVKVMFDKSTSYRGTLAKMGSPNHILILTKEIRSNLEKNVGDSVHILVELDTEERTVELPEVIKQLFRDFPKAKSAFDELSYTRRKEYVSFISSAKKQETQERRVQKVIEELLK